MKYCEVKKLVADPRSTHWWENLEDKSKASKSVNKWKTLQHNGVLFPPSYQPLPANIRIKYKGQPVKLDATNTNNPFNVTAEEAAVFFAQRLEQDDRLSGKNKERRRTLDDKKFMENFWKDWKTILGASSPIKTMADVDFTPLKKYITAHSEEKKSSKKALSKEEKKEEKEKKEEIKQLYGQAVVDGVLIPLGNYVVQPPGLYIGHGEHPMRGRIKKRVEPKDIILNVSKLNVPKCNINGRPCQWGDVVEDHSVTWIAAWRHPITNEMNYVWLKREESHWVCADDMVKFDKARKLDDNISTIRQKYTKDLSSSKINIRQLATAVYLLDTLAIRPGVDKDESKEAGTVGLTTLKCSNMKFEEGNMVTLDFTGKSSIRFQKTFQVSPVVFANLQSLCRGKGKTVEIFPSVNAVTLNDYLKTLMPDLTAKVFRTWKASSILQSQLDSNIPDPDIPMHEKKLMYDKVNIEVAKALNHKKMGTSDERVEKLKQKITELKEKKKQAKTDKQKASAQKSLDLAKAKLEEAEQNISTSTSKVNYLDPRITIAWAKKGQVAIEKIFNKAQLKKFVWAMETPTEWKF